ncbi:DNA-binding SARP family transcriptional activator [Herbihabitans rhizosphaerae]|uniref:DNA-binding SARP family transcriptional activator n=1 Tax=Herbihabitans rhizosphaerae TaxID=1872711 RepID=A0A4V2ERT5_9PSEU|nr:BTAD domain-containing putative transcriptional regulator [Herbihabitans rhizosphaerae]RZS33987.1 DNA-binding SARP family transcriptional activator [Herbihabitans rhizosphaerae]
MAAGEQGWSFDVLGPLRVTRDGEPVELGAPQARAVLAVLVLHAGRVISAERLIDEVWGASPPPSARVQLQGLISQLRRSLRTDAREAFIATGAGGYELRAPVGTRDVDRFEEHVAAARDLISAGDVVEGAARLRTALATWRGRPLDGIEVPAARQAAEHLSELRLGALEDVVAAELELGEHGSLVGELAALVEENPLRERFRGQRMIALARSGRVPEALDAYREWHSLLVDELGVEPSAEVRAIHAGVLRAEPGLRPEAVNSVIDPAKPRQLPPDRSGFIGRRQLLGELTDEFVRPRDTPPVVVVTGAAGSGKTALSVRLAHSVGDSYPDGHLFAQLRGTSADPVSPKAVLARFLRALRVPIDMIPADLDECAALFRDMLSGRRVLLVLDDAADEAQVRLLIPAEAMCAVVITSRQRLSGLEWGRSVKIGALTDTESTALLAEVVGGERVAADPEAARTLADYCGGLPLALRIVGAQLVDRPHWTLLDMVDRMAAERGRLDWLAAGDIAVRASFALSYERLGATHQTLFRRLGLLPVPTFASWVAAALVDTDEATGERLLADLVATNLVEPVGRASGGPRYRLHDLLRVFAAETVEREPEAERTTVVERAVGAWLYLAEQAAARLPGSVLQPAPGHATRWARGLGEADRLVADAIGWFDAELPGLDSVIAVAAGQGLAEHAWELAVVCGVYFDHQAVYPQWRQCYLRALPAARGAAADRGVASLLRGLGQIDIYEDRFADAVAALEESKEISERIGDRHGVARAILGLGTIHRVQGRMAEVLGCGDEAIPVLDELGDLHGGVQARIGRSGVYLSEGRIDEARDVLDDAMQMCAKLGDQHRTANVHLAYGEMRLRENNATGAMKHFRTALRMLESLGDQRCTAQVRLRIGRAHVALGHDAEATSVLADASAQFATLGNGTREAECALLLGQIAARTRTV